MGAMGSFMPRAIAGPTWILGRRPFMDNWWPVVLDGPGWEEGRNDGGDFRSPSHPRSRHCRCGGWRSGARHGLARARGLQKPALPLAFGLQCRPAGVRQLMDVAGTMLGCVLLGQRAEADRLVLHGEDPVLRSVGPPCLGRVAAGARAGGTAVNPAGVLRQPRRRCGGVSPRTPSHHSPSDGWRRRMAGRAVAGTLGTTSTVTEETRHGG